MDAPHCQFDARSFQSLPPRQNMLVDTVDQSPIKIEQKRGHRVMWSHESSFLPRGSPTRRWRVLPANLMILMTDAPTRRTVKKYAMSRTSFSGPSIGARAASDPKRIRRNTKIVALASS